MAKRPLVLTGGTTGDQTFDTDVLVQVRPANAYSTPDQLPVRPLFRRGMYQSRIPGHGTETVRPSDSSTRSVSSVTLTFSAQGPCTSIAAKASPAYGEPKRASFRRQ